MIFVCEVGELGRFSAVDRPNPYIGLGVIGLQKGDTSPVGHPIVVVLVFVPDELWLGAVGKLTNHHVGVRVRRLGVCLKHEKLAVWRDPWRPSDKTV